MLSCLLTHLNPSSIENLLLTISDHTRLKMRSGKSIIKYVSRICSISQQMQGVTMDIIIPILAIASLDHDLYPSMNSRYLVGDPTLVNCNLLDLSGLLSIKETMQQALGLPISTPLVMVNCVSVSQSQPPPTGCPKPLPIQPLTMTLPTDYPPPRGVACKRTAAMVRSDTSFPGCHFNKPNDSPHLKFHQEVGFPALKKHGYIW